MIQHLSVLTNIFINHKSQNATIKSSRSARLLKGFPLNQADDAKLRKAIGGQQIGEGNGSPLQHSCLENPVDRGAWWAAVHRVTELDTNEAT